MKKLLIGILFLLSLFNLSLKAQKYASPEWKPDIFSVGVGLGFDYGGVGGHFILYPQKNIGLFAGIGWVPGGVGFNGGVKLRIKNEASPVDPYFMAMYGYNAVAYSQTDNRLNKIFYGPSFGIGIDVHRRKYYLGYWSFALLVPIRSEEARTWASQPSNGSFFPLSFSVGYKFIVH
jgi:hypothetical protein